ncbi:hypothetical protein ACKLNR_007582 [Fusarium oxysporum f. sp. zingiberi]
MICTVLSAQSESQLSSVIQAKAIAELSNIGTVPILCYDYTFELSHYITDDQLTRNHHSIVRHKYITKNTYISRSRFNPKPSILDPCHRQRINSYQMPKQSSSS